MAKWTVKRKLHPIAVLSALAVVTFALSAARLLPQNIVENRYSNLVFPTISHIAAFVADAVPFSWLDVAILVCAGILIYVVRKRDAALLLAVVCAAYLWFFWTWGLNYHREPLEKKMAIDTSGIHSGDVEEFAKTAAAELNRLWPVVAGKDTSKEAIAARAADRVRLVYSRIEGRDWQAANRIKRSILADEWFAIAGVDGIFNPFGHEPVVASGVLQFELPFVMSHELAHVRGIPNEGDANLIALFATIASGDPAFEYSGWMYLWLYLRNEERDKLLEPGPRRDLELLFARMRAQEAPWASSLQAMILDWHLKANNVPEGRASYSKFVALAMATRDRWKDFQ
jgi:hypothetical protein